MPRPQTAKSSARTADDDSKRQRHPKNTKQLLSEVLGGDLEFAETFFGESHNMTRTIQGRSANADGDVSMNGGQGANGTGDVEEPTSKPIASDGSGHRQIPRPMGNSAITIENTPHDIDHLIICQLQEDLDSYRYDADFCKTQLDPDSIDSITPAEARTFQLRLLDLGHQMRSIHHRIQVMRAVISNSSNPGFHAGAGGAATANAYFGVYPPGTSLQPSLQQGYSAVGPSTPHDGRGRPSQRSSAYAMYNESGQDRRGPGRPLGSKNRSRPPSDAVQAAGVGTVGSAKAAALASAGAKRTLPSEILVATTNEDGNADGDAGLALKPKPGKRPRLDAGVDTPTSINAEGQSSTGAALAEIRDSDDTGSTSETSEARALSADHAPEPQTRLPSTPIVVAQPTNTFTSANRPSSKDSVYTRLGHWMCTLCTSQKYLKHPPPKQPAEPSSWALRDISKIVTHFTRMHTEHTDVERCQELGNALRTNVGPFTYWIRVTKKTPVSDGEVQEAIADLKEGKLPDLLRKLSAAAAKFPGRN